MVSLELLQEDDSQLLSLHCQSIGPVNTIVHNAYFKGMALSFNIEVS